MIFIYAQLDNSNHICMANWWLVGVCKQENTYDVIIVFYVKNHVQLPNTVTILTEFIVSTGRFVERIADGGWGCTSEAVWETGWEGISGPSGWTTADHFVIQGFAVGTFSTWGSVQARIWKKKKQVYYVLIIISWKTGTYKRICEMA